MRLDRPIGTWLLYWPCAWSVALTGVRERWDLLLWLALGAFAMRSAGCVYNDIVDRDLDREIERTRLRPLASERVSLRSAWMLVGILCLIGFVVLLQLKPIAAIVALASIAPVAAYPFMYYETMEQVLSKVDKTIVEANGVTPYLPLPQIQKAQPQSQGRQQ